MKPPVGSVWRFRRDLGGNYDGPVIVRKIRDDIVVCDLPEWTGPTGTVRSFPLSYWQTRLVAA